MIGTPMASPPPDRLAEIESRMELLAVQVADLRARLARLEPPVEPPAPAAGVPTNREGPADWAPLSTTAALIGRTLVVLGGAYLIRAMADSNVVHLGTGVGIGLGYATWWMLRADQAAAKGDRPSALFHALASGLIALPLLFETATRFHLMGARATLLVLVTFLAGALGVARRRALDTAAALLATMGLVTVVALFGSLHDLLGTAWALLAIALGVEALAPERRWEALRWPTAAVLDAAMLALVALVARPTGLPESYVGVTAGAAFVAALALPALHLAALAVHTLVRGREVTAFEMTQVPAALLIGLPGAWRLAAAQGHSPVGLGVAVVVLGGLCYAAAFLFAERRAGSGRNFYFYAAAAGLLTLVGAGTLFAGTMLVAAGCALAIGAAVAARRFGRWTLALHGTLYLLATALTTGFIEGAVRALFAIDAPPGAGWRLGPPFLLVALAVYRLVAHMQRPTPLAWWSRVPDLFAAFVTVLGAAGMLAEAALAGLDRLHVAAQMAATAGTAILALVALVTAWVGARWRLVELGWLVHPLLVVGGLKLVAMDLRHGAPGALFVSFVLYGAALSVAPRLLRSRGARLFAEP
jgi:hypothetical protein